MRRRETSWGVRGEVKGWWVDVRGWVACGGDVGVGTGMGEEGSGEVLGVKRGKEVTQSGAKPVGAGRWDDFTAAWWRARRRFPSGVAPPAKGVLGRACRTRRSPGSSDC